MELTRQVPIKISEEAHAKATAEAKAQGTTIAKHLSTVVNGIILAPPEPTGILLKADDWNNPENDHWDELATVTEPIPQQQPETKVVAEPAQAPYVFQGI